MKKLTYQQVKSHIESFDYQLLSNYTNSRSPITLKCPYDHIYETTYGKFKQGYRCTKCANNIKRNSIEKVNSIIEEKGFKGLDGEYTTIKSKLTVKCPNNHIYETTFENIRNGSRCPYCHKNRIYIPYYREQCEKIGYTFLKITRKGSGKIHFKCNYGHYDSMILDYGNQGIRCRYCDGKKIYGTDILFDVYNNGGLLINRNRKNITSKTKLKLKCRECGYIGYANYIKFKRLSKECPYCYKIKQVQKYYYEAEKEGYRLITSEPEDFIRNYGFYYICPRNHLGYTIRCNWDNGQRCNLCGLDELKERSKKNRKLMEGKKLYDSGVDYYTKISLKNYFDVINPDNIDLNGENTVDHKYSKKQGYLDGILPYIVGSPINLQIVGRNENSSKNYKCSITKEKLFERYHGFI